ncbi:hypothetical protein V8E36_000319 [Tilletia maclaganii]
MAPKNTAKRGAKTQPAAHTAADANRAITPSNDGSSKPSAQQEQQEQQQQQQQQQQKQEREQSIPVKEEPGAAPAKIKQEPGTSKIKVKAEPGSVKVKAEPDTSSIRVKTEPGAIKVKEEPGTSAIGIKTEPGTSTAKVKAEADSSSGSDDTDAAQEGSEDEDGAPKAYHVCVKCLPLASFEAKAKNEKLVGLTRIIFLQETTKLETFLDKVERTASIELVGPRSKWLLCIESRGRNDPFKDGVALDLEDEMCSATYATWIKGISGGTAIVKVYGIAKTAIVSKGGEDSRVPLKHVDPAIASAAERIVKANLCSDTTCSLKSIAYPACWPIPCSDEHLNLTEANVLAWATALAAGDDKVSEKKAPKIPPHIREKGKEKADKKRKSKKDNKKDKKRSKTSHASSSKDLDDDVPDVEFVEMKQAPEPAPKKARVPPVTVSIEDSSDIEIEQDKEDAAAADEDDAVRSESKQQDVQPLVPHRRKPGAYMLLNDFAATFGLPEKIRKKLEDYLCPDTHILAELQTDGYEGVGLVKAEPKVLDVVLERWFKNEPLPATPTLALAQMSALSDHGIGSDKAQSAGPPAYNSTRSNSGPLHEIQPKDVGGDGCGVPHAPPRLRCISAALPRGRISLPPNAGETRGRKRRKIHLRGLGADLQSPSPGLYLTIENEDLPPPISAGSPRFVPKLHKL